MLMILLVTILLLAAALSFLVLREVRQKNMHIWLGSYLKGRKKTDPGSKPVHILFAFCDHFEPGWHNANLEVQTKRVDRWCIEYPELARRHRDADGCFPKHSFFYPEEEYEQSHLEKLADLCSEGFGEIEIHLHHDNDTADGLRSKLHGFLKVLDEKHHAVPRNPETGAYQFAFIHGNWTLDNSGENGRHCGVNNELAVLAEVGCYADFTLPSAPSSTQTRKINSIYYARGRDGHSKSHDDGVDVEAGNPGTGDLVMIQGPLALNWKNRKFGVLPRIENADIRASSPPTTDRIDLWVKTAIHVKNRPEWRFIKVHTHGTQEGDIDTLLGEPVDSMFQYLESRYNDGKNFILHYVSAREMYNIAKAAEAGETGDPGNYRDYEIPRPSLLGTGD